MFGTFKSILIIALCCKFISSALAVEKPQIYKMHLSHFLPRTSVAHRDFLKPWAEKVEKETNGRLKVRIHPAMSLGGAPSELVPQARSGAIDAIWTVVGYTPDQFPKTGVFELPFISDSPKSTVLNMAINEYYESGLGNEYDDFYVVLLHAHAPGAIHMRGKKITRLDELKGLKIRVPNRIMGDFVNEVGAVPVSMPLSDVYEGLTYGMLSGVMAPFEVAVALRFHEQTNYHVLAPFYTTVFAFLINKEFYDALPSDIQKVIDNNSKSNIAYSVGEVWDKAEAKMIERVKSKGGKLYYLSDKEISKGKKLSKKLVDIWKSKNGKIFYDKARSLLAKYKEQQE